MGCYEALQTSALFRLPFLGAFFLFVFYMFVKSAMASNAMGALTVVTQLPVGSGEDPMVRLAQENAKWAHKSAQQQAFQLDRGVYGYREMQAFHTVVHLCLCGQYVELFT